MRIAAAGAALDPNVLPPTKMTDTSSDAFASAKKLRKPLVRVGAVTTTDEATKAALVTCFDKLQRMASRALLAAPSKTPAKISAPFACSQEGK